jgi:putative Mg2+ transporter-C (MgtC) family protein
METLSQELAAGLPDWAGASRLALRLLLAALLGAVVGYDRERMGKPAGLRTHVLVAMGAALFVLAPIESDMQVADLSRVIQGLAAGIGFLGAGAILKLSSERQILGLTTAATIWITAALGVTVGLGHIGLALVTVALAWLTLSLGGWLERRWESTSDDARFADEMRARTDRDAED